MMRLVAVFTFLLIVGVCSYIVLNPRSYSTLVLCFASFAFMRGDPRGCSSVERLSFSFKFCPAVQNH
jgi:hypothetical protein